MQIPTTQQVTTTSRQGTQRDALCVLTLKRKLKSTFEYNIRSEKKTYQNGHKSEKLSEATVGGYMAQQILSIEWKRFDTVRIHVEITFLLI